MTSSLSATSNERSTSPPAPSCTSFPTTLDIALLSFRCEPLRSCARRSGMARASPSRSRHVFRDEKRGGRQLGFGNASMGKQSDQGHSESTGNRETHRSRAERYPSGVVAARSPVWCV
jgi:hypothetical protein